MRILFTNNSPLIKYGLNWGLQQLGHETKVMDGDYQLWDKNKEVQIHLFKKMIEEYRPNLVFSECFAGMNEEIFLHTSRLSIPHFYWAIEDVWTQEHPNKGETNWIGDYWCDYADAVFTTTIERLDYYNSKEKKADVLLFGCNPDFHNNRIPEDKFKSDISLVGTNYSSRYEQTKNFVMPLVKNNYNFKIYGSDWWIDRNRPVNLLGHENFYHGSLPYEWMPIVYSSSKIALGVNCNDGSMTQSSMRMYEVLASGGAILVSAYTKAQESIFGNHCFLPKTTDELFSMIDHVLSMSDTQRKEFAMNAQKFVYENHNYKLRAQQIINIFYKL